MIWKNLLFEYLDDNLNKKYCLPIIEELLNISNIDRKKDEWKIKIKKTNEIKRIKRGDIKKLCGILIEKTCDEGYSSLVIPTIISVDQAPNFFITKEIPKEEELWWWFYYLFTGLHCRIKIGRNKNIRYVINIANVDKKILDEFRKYLKENNFLIFEKERMGLDIKEMLSKFNLPGMPLDEFIFGFLILAYFSKFLSEIKEKARISRELKDSGHRIDDIPDVTDEASLLIFVLSRQKKKVYIFPKLRKLISSWFNEPEKLSSFLFSFYITDKTYRDLSRSLLNKFLYYFLQNKVNGELLSKLVELKVFYELKRKGRIYGIYNAQQFFSKL